jgi:hypothetical protein
MIIKDKLIEPYEIHYDGLQYTIGKPHVSAKGEKSLKNTSYFHSIEYAISKIISIKMGEKQDVVTLQEFYDEFKIMFKEVKEAIGI